MSSHTEPLPGTDSSDNTVSDGVEKKTGWFLKMFDSRNKKIGWAVTGAAAGAAIAVGALLPKGNSDFNNPDVDGQPGIEVTAFPHPDDPNYDPFLEIGNNSDLSISSIDRLAGYFTSPEVSRESLIQALSQANQEEVDRILEVIDDYDSGNNAEITALLNKYGLETSEVPVNPLGRISEENDFTEQELNVVSFDFYPEISYDTVRETLAEFSQADIDVVRDVVNGQSSGRVLNDLMRTYGVELGDEYAS